MSLTRGTIYFIPKQLVIFVEENSNIKDELKMKLIFPSGEEIRYTVPTMKYWEYSEVDIMNGKMYPLLPLQIFKLRYRLEQLKRKHTDTSGQIREIIIQAKCISEQISREASNLFQSGEIDGDDFHKMKLNLEGVFTPSKF